jgi:hypothetical protein
VEKELEKEYSTISTAVIGMVVGVAKTIVAPAEGRVKLLEVARKSLRR